MGSAKSLIKKVSAVLNKVGPPDKLVYLRVTTRTGADPLKGYPGTVTVADTLLSPQPYYTPLGRERVPGGHTKVEDAVIGTGKIATLDDWLFYISPDALSLSQLSDPDFVLVKKVPGDPATFGTTPFGSGTETSSASQEEIFRLMDVDPAMIYGADVLYSCYMRSTTRQ
jgi:hypothetical protein